MSRKTVPFKMPAKGSGERNHKPRSGASNPSTDPRSPLSSGSEGASAESGSWVQNAAPVAARKSAAPPPAPAVLAAAWHLWGATALLLALAPALGCFWLLNLYRTRDYSAQKLDLL